MADEANPKTTAKAAAAADEPAPDANEDEAGADARLGALSDLVRRAVSASVGAGRTAKDDIMRAASTEIRTWLDKLDLNGELVKALSKMVIEVKTEVRFRPTEDGKLVPEIKMTREPKRD